MAVQPQTPYKEHIANGTTTGFNLGFDCDDQDYLIVLVDDVEPVVGTWSLIGGAVVFGTAPASGKKITVQRNTPFERKRDYQSYDNSFRPPVVNKDFDHIWLKTQELGVADWLLSNKIQKFRDDVNLTALENTLEEAKQIRDETGNSVIEVQSNVEQSQTLLVDTTSKANQAEASATAASAANTAAQQALVQANAAEGNVYAALSSQTATVNTALTGFTNGASKWYATLALAEADIANIGIKDKVDIGEITNGGTWYKATAGATSLTKSPYDPLTQANGYTDTSTTTLKENFIVGQSDEGIFFLTLDRVPLFYVLNDGSFHLNGDITDLRAHIDEIPKNNTDPFFLEITDAENKIIGYLDKDLELFFVNNPLSLQAQVRKAQYASNLNLALNSMLEVEGRTLIAKKAMSDKSAEIKKIEVIEPFGGATGQVQRIAAMLRLANNKILYMWGGGIGAPYNGDGEGVKLYKRIITYDNAGRILDKGEKVLFRSTSLEAGIAKHPMLGRTATGSIVLIWDERNTVYSTTNAYSTMIAFSDDEGATFTAPVQIPNNPEFTFQVVGSTGTILTMPNGRLVCPMYYTLPAERMGMMYSDDNGATWQYGETLTINGVSLQEPSISLDADNNIIVSSRHTLTNRRKHISKSTDGGVTLVSVGFNNDLEAPNVASSILYDAESGLMLHSSPTGQLRDKYSIQLSADNGVTWKVAYQPFTANYYVGYTQIIKLSTDLYAVAVEGLTDSAVVNSKDNAGIFIFNIKEALSNVYRN